MPIFDQGYQHWDGRLAGHAWRWLAIARQGVRTQLSGRYIRLLILAAWMPALTLISVLTCWGLIEQGGLRRQPFFEYFVSLATSSDTHVLRKAVWTVAFSLFFLIENYFIMLIVTLAGPGLISRDLRNNAFPLYFSRPLTRLDYFLGKLGVIATLVATVAVLPAVVAYLLGICFSLDASVLRDTWRLLPGIVGYGALIVVSAGTLMLMLSALSRRSIYVGIAWAGIWLIGWVSAWSLEINHLLVLQHNAEAEIAQRDQLAHPRAADRPFGDASDDPDFETPQPPPPPLPEEQTPFDAQARTKAARHNWRWLVCYNFNLQRLGDELLGTDAAWVQLEHAGNEAARKATGMLGAPRSLAGPMQDDRLMADFMVMQFPWTWSAGVLAALMGASVCILSLRVKSLDRLR